MQPVDHRAERRLDMCGERPEAERERIHAAACSRSSSRSRRVKRSSVRAMTAPRSIAGRQFDFVRDRRGDHRVARGAARQKTEQPGREIGKMMRVAGAIVIGDDLAIPFAPMHERADTFRRRVRHGAAQLLTLRAEKVVTTLLSALCAWDVLFGVELQTLRIFCCTCDRDSEKLFGEKAAALSSAAAHCSPKIAALSVVCCP